MKKYKNEEHSRLPILIMEAAMFLKMQNFSAFENHNFNSTKKKNVSKFH